MEIKYPIGAWDKATKDFQALELEMSRVQKLLGITATDILNSTSDSDSESENEMK
jgi:hypothetical protein